ncbi:MAG: PilZ domain-containing protein [Planctomycetes bacterium]|nr:PilZ domain-containing protein [Planctomycetota bacterium]
MLYGQSCAALIPLAARTPFAPREPSPYGFEAVIIVGIAAIILFVSLWLLNLYKKNREETSFWKDVEEHLNDYDIRPRIRDRLLGLLRRMNLRDPYRAITNVDTFDRLVREKFISMVGQNACEEVRRVLFILPTSEAMAMGQESPVDNFPLNGGPEMYETGTLLDEASVPGATWGGEEEPAVPESVPYEMRPGQAEIDLNGSYSLKPGNEVKLRFASAEDLYLCIVVFVETQDFIVSLPPPEKLRYLPREGETVEGFITRKNNYYSFETTVREIFFGEARLCRLRHTSLLHEVRRREFSRTQIGLEFNFYSFSEKAMIASTSQGKQLGKIVNMRKGTLHDISAGGCAVETTDMAPPIKPRDFLRFPITLLDNDEPIEVFGLVLSVVQVKEDPAARKKKGARAGKGNEDTNKERYRLHVIFVGLDTLIRERLAQTVSRLSIKTQE